MNTIKIQLLNYCFEYLDIKLKVLESELRLAQESTSDQSKSSVGDKHETGRAMAQLEQEKLSAQFLELEKQKQILTKINPEVRNQNIGLGSLVKTNKGLFFLAIAIGKVTLNNSDYFIISLSSPIGQALLNQVGNKTSFNGSPIEIDEVI